MFTGIVQSLGIIVELAPHRLVIDAPGIDEALGASVAVDGCCLTVTSNEPAPVDRPRHPESPDGAIATRRLSFDILPETLERTRLSALAPAAPINLEAALRAGEPLGGHLVQGHVDAVGTVRRSVFDAASGSRDLEIDVPEQVLRYCVDRGSITVNGTSLTVMGLDQTGIRLQLIAETQQRTNLGTVVAGDLVNLEADVIARYVDRLMGSNR